MELNFRLCDGLPLGFDYKGTSWNDLTWFERKRHNCIINFNLLKKGRFQDFVNYSGYFSKYYFNYSNSEDFRGVVVNFDRVYWENHKPWVKFKFVFNLRIDNRYWLLIRG